MQLNLKQQHWDVMRAHVEDVAPLEACGLLTGKDGAVKEVLLIANQARSPVKFRMDPTEQLRAFNWMESNGLDLLGIFHSHPAGPETVSPTDIGEAAYPVVHVIWSRVEGVWRTRGFWIEGQNVTEVKLIVTPDK